jgi:phage N-6-adenine-methyltransferase
MVTAVLLLMRGRMMAINSGLYSSASDRWDTPADLVADLASVFAWDLDVCAAGPNVCDNYYSIDRGQDGLSLPWRGLCWCNPPYGRGIGAWVERARRAAADGAGVVMLLPARTDPAWWQNDIAAASLVVFIRGRLTFGSADYWRRRWYSPYMIDRGRLRRDPLFGRFGVTQSAPFPSAFVVFGHLPDRLFCKLATYGWAVYQ